MDLGTHGFRLGSEWAPWLPASALALSEGPASERVFPFTYPEYLLEFHKSIHRQGLKAVPYQARHSGPSIDAARLCRTREEIKARGRWAADKSVLRYEQRARLMKSVNALSPSQASLATQCEARIEELLRGQCQADILPLPATRA